MKYQIYLLCNIRSKDNQKKCINTTCLSNPDDQMLCSVLVVICLSALMFPTVCVLRPAPTMLYILERQRDVCIPSTGNALVVPNDHLQQGNASLCRRARAPCSPRYGGRLLHRGRVHGGPGRLAGLTVAALANPTAVEHILRGGFENYPKGVPFSTILTEHHGLHSAMLPHSPAPLCYIRQERQVARPPGRVPLDGVQLHLPKILRPRPQFPRVVIVDTCVCESLEHSVDALRRRPCTWSGC
jgi:hypothetical protein